MDRRGLIRGLAASVLLGPSGASAMTDNFFPWNGGVGVSATRSVILDDAYGGRILYDAIGDKYRLWCHQNYAPTLEFAYREASTIAGLSTATPVIIRSGERRYGSDVIDEGVAGPERFKNSYSQSGLGYDGAYIETSPDGVTWTPATTTPTLTPAQADDIISLWKNPTTGKYGIFCKRWSGAHGTSLRQTWLSSHGSSGWPEPVPVFTADPADHANTQFYGAVGPIVRNGVMIFFLRVLRDDLERGVGYTVLAWSRDGVNFARCREPFLTGRRGQPDEAMAWVTGAFEKDGTLYLTYTALELGHKGGPRRVMLATMPSSALAL
jgi:hypothetical protein